MDGTYPITEEAFETFMDSIILGYTEAHCKLSAVLAQKAKKDGVHQNDEKYSLIREMIDEYSECISADAKALNKFRILQTSDIEVQPFIVVEGIKMLPGYMLKSDWDRFVKFQKEKVS